MRASPRRFLPFRELTPFEQRIAALSAREKRDRSPLGSAAGLSPYTVQKWCDEAARGTAPPGRARELAKLAEHYSLSLDWLLSNDPLPDGYELPASGAVTADVTQLAPPLVRLWIDPQSSVTLASSGHAEERAKMQEFPDSVRNAVLAAIHMWGYSIEETVRAVEEVVAELRAKGHRPEDYVPSTLADLIRDKFVGRPRSGTYPSSSRIRLSAAVVKDASPPTKRSDD